VTRRRSLVLSVLGALALGGALTVVDPAGASVRGWLAYAIVCVAGAVALWLVWYWQVGASGPRWLLACVLVGLLMRAGVAVALLQGLPRFGYDEKVQRAGYVFFDAYKRDTDAWAVAKTDRSLWLELTEPRITDQYGGMLFLSAAIYRTLSPDAHRQLLISILTTFASTLGILFAWGFASRAFGPGTAVLATWAMAVYPEGVLLASSQMREPFVMTAIAAALLGYSLLRDGRGRAGVTTILVAGASVLLISPPYALLTLAVAVLAGLWEGRMGWRRTWSIALPVLAVGALGLLLLVQAWTGLREIAGAPLEALIRWWGNAGAQWRLNLLDEQSGWISTLFNLMPAWGQLPFVVFYGLVQPLLPAAIAYPGAPIWRIIAIWRSLGWYALLPFLLYAPFPALGKGNRRSLQAYLAVLVWLGAVVAAYRATSYQWDSPRYRAVFLVAQVALAAWAWQHARQVRSPWLTRSAILLGIPTLALLLWYLGRYYELVSMGLFTGMGASLLVDVVLIVWWMIRRPHRMELSQE
jgi:hypothetical protein